jgi:drug/metabolite transporter (DMT)-like permease
MTSPGNAAIIGLCEVFTTYLLFNTFRGEHMSYTHRVGAVLTVSGSLIVLLNGFTGLNFGDVLIFLSICTAPFGNLLQKKAAEFVHSRTVILMRVLVALPILIALTYLFEPIQEIPMQTPILLALAINGILIAVTRLMWLVSITHLPPAEASALSAAGPLVTILFMWLLLNTPPETVQLVSIPFICVGVYLLSRTEYRRRHR